VPGLHCYHLGVDGAEATDVYVELPGTDHERQTWRRNLHDFAPRLFR
jgi:enterochelin esterase family protein